RPRWTDGRVEVAIHPASIIHEAVRFRHRFLVFHEKMSASRIFLRETSVVSPYALLLFGGAITVRHEHHQVMVDGWIPLKAAAQTAVLFKELRRALDALLVNKISNPTLDMVGEGVVPTIVKLLLDEDQTIVQAS
ncbi:hypothetical protein CYMTET_26837, partial [Cymbomonas tetramitiformis]